MKLISAFLTIIFLFISSLAFAMQASSDTKPARFVKSRGKTQFAYNIHKVDGTWQWDYVEIEGKVTAAKIREALRLAKNEDQSFDPADIEVEQTLVEEKLAQIAQMTYAQVDNHVDNTFSNLSSAQRASLKKLYKSVLALIKQLNLE